MSSHIHDVTKALAAPICGATTGVCVDSDRARCPACLALYEARQRFVHTRDTGRADLLYVLWCVVLALAAIALLVWLA